jgi:hypothetical protein
VNRRFRSFPLEDLLLAQLPAGFLLAAGWTVMYEVYHEEGSYYSTLMQEILSTEGLFPYFVVSAILMAVPLGLVLDAVRQVVGEMWLGLAGRSGEPALDWLHANPAEADALTRYVLYRHARATALTPARAAGNLGLVLLIFLLWFVVKIVRIQGWTVFSLAFIVGTPLVGLVLITVLLVRYVHGLREFYQSHERTLAPAVPAAGTPAPAAADERRGAPAFPA